MTRFADRTGRSTGMSADATGPLASRKPGLAPSKQPPAGGRTRNYRGHPSREQLHPRHCSLHASPGRGEGTRAAGAGRYRLPDRAGRILSCTGQKARLVGSAGPAQGLTHPRHGPGGARPQFSSSQEPHAMDLADPRIGGVFRPAVTDASVLRGRSASRGAATARRRGRTSVPTGSSRPPRSSRAPRSSCPYHSSWPSRPSAQAVPGQPSAMRACAS